MFGNRDNGLPLLYNLPSDAPEAPPPAKPLEVESTLSKETKALLETGRVPARQGDLNERKNP